MIEAAVVDRIVDALLLCVTECVLEILYREWLFLSVRCV